MCAHTASLHLSPNVATSEKQGSEKLQKEGWRDVDWILQLLLLGPYSNYVLGPTSLMNRKMSTPTPHRQRNQGYQGHSYHDLYILCNRKHAQACERLLLWCLCSRMKRFKTQLPFLSLLSHLCSQQMRFLSSVCCCCFRTWVKGCLHKLNQAGKLERNKICCKLLMLTTEVNYTACVQKASIN